MSQLKVCTYNLEWMTSFFGAGADDAWRANPVVLPSFPGKSTGDINLSPIADVHGLCSRIAAGIRTIDPDVLFVEEGPPLQEQMALFVATFLGDDYVSYRSNRAAQAIHALVRRTLANDIKPWLPAASTEKQLWRDVPFYPWGKIAAADRKKHSLARYPLLLRADMGTGQDLILAGVHTKSKFSKLKTKQQWDNRAANPEPVLDALGSRQKLSSEVARLRSVLSSVIAAGPLQASVIVVGDFNDGPFHDLMEKEFLTKNILDELVGSFLDPNTYFKHAMEAPVLSAATTTRFKDPLQGGALVEELIDHMVVSPAIWSGLGAYRIKLGSCQVDEAAWQMGVVGDPEAARDNRPSDHKPVSVVLEW
jgi:hypothetical protein